MRVSKDASEVIVRLDSHNYPLRKRIGIGFLLGAVFYIVTFVVPWMCITLFGDPDDHVQRAVFLSAGLVAGIFLLLGYCAVRRSQVRKT